MSGIYQSTETCARRFMTLKESSHNNYCLDGILNGSIPICVLDEKHQIRYANNAFAGLFGKNTDEITDCEFYSLWNCTLSDSLRIEIENMLNGNRPAIQTLEHVSEDGGKTYYRLEASKYIDTAGKIGGLIISCIDISAERRAVQRLKESGATARAFMNMPTDLTLIINPDGKILDIGNNMNNCMHSAKGMEIGKLFWDYFSPDVAMTRRECLADVIRFKTPAIFEDKCRGRWYYNVFHPIENEYGDVIKITVYSREITKYKQTENDLKNANSKLEMEEQVIQEKKIALKQLLNHIDDEKEKIGAAIQANIANITMPLIKKMEVNASSIDQNYIAQLKNSLKEVVSPFIDRLDSTSSGLTSREFEICALVRNGMSTKEIASMLNTSSDTVKNQRKSIRKKLGISGNKENLFSFLQKLQAEDSDGDKEDLNT